MQPKDLPARPNIEQYKNQAKDLLRKVAAGAPDAIERFRQSHPRLVALSDAEIREEGRLTDAQLVIAREHGCESWPAFARQIRAADQPRASSVLIPADGVALPADISLPNEAQGLVLLLHARSGERRSHHRRHLMEALNRASLGVLSTDLLTPEEGIDDDATDEMKLDVRRMGHRVAKIAEWLMQVRESAGLSIGYMGWDTAAAAAAYAASEDPQTVRALVFSAGRPDLAGPWLWKIEAASLFLVGEKATLGRAFNHSAMRALSAHVVSRFDIIAGAGERFDDDDALRQSARSSCEWFRQHLAGERA